MGRIKTKLIKRLTFELLKEHAGEFKKDFNENKEILTRFMDVPSKKLRNTIAGYLTRLVKSGYENIN